MTGAGKNDLFKSLITHYLGAGDTWLPINFDDLTGVPGRLNRPKRAGRGMATGTRTGENCIFEVMKKKIDLKYAGGRRYQAILLLLFVLFYVGLLLHYEETTLNPFAWQPAHATNFKIAMWIYISLAILLPGTSIALKLKIKNNE